MGILESLFGGGDSDPYALYGDLFTPQQKAALQARDQSQGLLRMAGAFAKAGMPSRLPVPMGAVLGSAAEALGTGSDENVQNAMRAMLYGAQAKKLQTEQQFLKDFAASQPDFMKTVAGILATGAAVPTAPAASPTPPGGPLAAPAAVTPGGLIGEPDADLGGISATEARTGPLASGASLPAPVASLAAYAGDRGDPRGLVPYIRQQAIARGIDPDVAVKVAQSEGLGSFQSSVIQKGGQREPSYGAFQLYTGGGMGNEFQQATGLDPSDPKNERATIDYALDNVVHTGWTPFHGARGAGIGPRTGLPGQDTVIPSGSGGLPILQVQAPGGPLAAPSAAPATGGGPLAPPGAPAADPRAAQMQALMLAIAQRRAMAILGGIKDPYEPLMDAVTKSPAFQGLVTGAQEAAKFPYAGPTAGSVRGAQQPYILEEQAKGKALDRINDLFKQGGLWDPKIGVIPTPGYDTLQERNAAATARGTASTQTTDLPTIGPTGPVKTPMTQLDKSRILSGETVPYLGVQPYGAAPAAPSPAAPVVPGGLSSGGAGGRLPTPAAPGGGPPLGSIYQEPVQTPAQVQETQAKGAAQTEMYKSGLKALDTAHDAVRAANQRAPYYGSMLTAMQGFQPGATAEARLTGMQYLRDLGIIKGDNVPQGEALRLAGERLAFMAVPPNQGSWSNVERQLLKSSLAGMSQTPEGLTNAIRMMQQLDDYDRKVSEIHRQVADKNGGLPNILEAQRRVEALGPPLTPAQQTALERLQQGGAPATAPDTQPGGEIIQNGWRYDAKTHKPIGPVQ